MGENPSSPEDRLEDALRRALSDAVGPIEPGTDGLDSIRARIGGRPPRPRLLAVLSGAVERARSWTWRGHWAWPGWPLTRAHLTGWSRRPRHRKGTPARKPTRRGDRLPLLGTLGTLGGLRIGWLTLVSGLASIAVIASVSFGVQPVRQAIIQAGTTVLHGGGYPPPWGGAGTDRAGTQGTTDGNGPLAGGGPTAAAQPSPTSAYGSKGGPSGAAPGPGSSAACQSPTAATGEPTTTPTATDSGTAASTEPADGTTSGATQTAYPTAASDVTGAPDQPTATPDSPTTSASTCAVTPGPATTAPATPTPPTTPTSQPEVTGAPSTPTDGTPAPIPADPPASTATGTPASTPTGTAAGPELATDTARSTTPAAQDNSPARLAESRSWRWYARLWFWHDERHWGQR